MSPLVRSPATIFQLNIGLYCNQVGTRAASPFTSRYRR